MIYLYVLGAYNMQRATEVIAIDEAHAWRASAISWIIALAWPISIPLFLAHEAIFGVDETED